MNQIEVFPKKDGTWNWRRRVDDQTKGTGDGYETRAEAIGAAREANGVETVTLTRKDGSPAGQAQVGQGEHRVVLLRTDGSMVGEIDHVGGGNSGSQSITLTPASDNSNAGQEA